VIEPERLTPFLKKIHLFHGLSDEQLGTVAAQLTDESQQAGTTVFTEGMQGDTFYLIFSGKVIVFRNHHKKKGDEEEEQQLAVLFAGDYFGEEALLTNQRRNAGVRIEEEAILLSLPRAKFLELLKKIPQMKPNFEISVESRKLSRRLQFKWVRSDEVIYFLARKHIILFFQAALGPLATFFILAFILSIAFLFLHFFFLLLIIAILGIFLGVVLLWEWVDWGNDYYIVTNQRVIWLEKVVGLYDSRHESPLPMLLSVSTETEPLGRFLDYGSVIIRTFVGRIVFHHVAHPFEVEALVKEHQNRAKEGSRRTEIDAMKKALTTRMNPNLEQTLPSSPQSPSTSKAKKKEASARQEGMFANLFKLRFEDKEIITYRKHWFVLLQQLWLPTALLLGILAALGVGIYYLYFTSASIAPTVSSERETLFVIVPFAFLVVLGWWIYQYVNWANDIYQVTPDQILDIERTPLGREDRTAAQLESILATEYERRGVLGILLNYGKVHITVGGSKMTFHDVFDPISVQQDIDRRRMARNAAKEETRIKAERERLADWFLAYNEITKPENEKNNESDQK
jgi:CRP-like cAMP-binding protein